MELTITLPTGSQRVDVVGAAEGNLKLLRETLGVNVAARGDGLRVTGDAQAVERAVQVVERLQAGARRQRPLTEGQVMDAIAESAQTIDPAGADAMPAEPVSPLPATTPPGFIPTSQSANAGPGLAPQPAANSVFRDPPAPVRGWGGASPQPSVGIDPSHHSGNPVQAGARYRQSSRHTPASPVPGQVDARPPSPGRPATAGADADRSEGALALEAYARGRRVKAMTPGQQHYLRAMLEHDLTVCVGPAGTGKTYLAVAAAVSLLKQGAARKLVLVRPAVEAGEKLGFLPGDMQQKVNPYLRPLLDALHDLMDFEQIQRFMACDVIEIIPLAFMRGRTLNDAVIILDEAQNTTKAQMLMFLTRLGHGSKMVVTGDTTQIDLPDPRDSGLIDAARRLMRVPGIAFVTLDQADIVRHNLVQRIITAYGDPSKQQQTYQEELAAVLPEIQDGQ